LRPLTTRAACCSGRVLLSPPGSADVLVCARVSSGGAAGSSSSEERGSGLPLDAVVSLRWTPVPERPSSFAELKAGSSGVTLRGATFHERTGLGAFAVASHSGSTSVGLRLSRAHLGLGVEVLCESVESSSRRRSGSGSGSGSGLRTPLMIGRDAHAAAAYLRDAPPIVAWAIARCGRFTFGCERRPMACDPFAARPLAQSASSPLVLLRRESVSLALAYRSAPAGRAAAFESILELTRQGDLVVSVLQHSAVRRRCKNPFEETSVAGITNYIDLGLRLAAPLTRERMGSGAAFELAAAWQINKNWLTKLKLGSHASEAALVGKSWWTPALTASLSASRRVGEPAARYGLWLSMDNVGSPRFERADPGQGATRAAARRYVATQEDMQAGRGFRPLMRDDAGRGAEAGAGDDAFAGRL
jgi:hypothetical protein